ncbi:MULTISPECIES: NmrA family NAD(P)-binding protein [unclassified Sphingomonas]|uniref:NmrA family NAD(P)-binding protein n=1 Tax=unclassified Sphingomonas TaxID=196159 RepID=UPI0009E8D74A|nr:MULTISPECIES: NmrA family NAD(P)-binding protein [unclassified Sphingomonas]
MTHPRILVTGATGKTGQAVVAELRRHGATVRALVRRRDKRSERLEREGVETVVGDLSDPGSVRTAVQGVRRAYFLPAFDPAMLEGATHFAAAAKDAGVESIVGLSQWLAGPAHPAWLTRQLWAMDELFGAIPGIAYTIVNPPFFADNYLRLIGFAAHLGILPSLTGNSRNAPPSNEDIAAVAAAALLDPETHGGRRYSPTGPELLSTRDMAAILTRVLARKVRAVEMPMWLFLKAARMQGVPADELSGFRYWVRDHAQGAFSFRAPTDDVRRVTGRAPESFDTIARRYAALPEARRSFGASARAWADFMRTPMMPGYDLDAFDQRLGLSRPADSRFAMEDAGWRALRSAQVDEGSEGEVLRVGKAA